MGIGTVYYQPGAITSGIHAIVSISQLKLPQALHVVHLFPLKIWMP